MPSDSTSIGIARRRLAWQRLIGPPFSDPVETVRWFSAVQAQDFAGAKWALGMRTAGATEAEVQADFDAGKILRTHVLRPTWHFVTPEDIRWMVNLTAPRVKALMATHDRQLDLTPRVFARSQQLIAEELRGGNFRTREELGATLKQKRIVASGQRLANIMIRAELDALVCSGPRRGNQFTYALLEERAPMARQLEREAALAELARRYFASHGPATLQDFAWWSGLTVADAKCGVRQADLIEEKFDGRSLWSDETMTSPVVKEPSVHLLPSYDEFTVGFRDRSDICTPEIAAKLPKTANGVSGVLGNMILVDGQIAGTWRRDVMRGSIQVHKAPARMLTAREKAGLQRAGERLGEFLGGLAVTWK